MLTRTTLDRFVHHIPVLFGTRNRLPTPTARQRNPAPPAGISPCPTLVALRIGGPPW